MRNYLILLAVAVAAVSCSGLKNAAGVSDDASLHVKSEYLSGGALALDLHGVIPKEYKNSNNAVTVVPVLESKDGANSYDLPTLLAEGRLHKKYDDRNERLADGDASPADLRIPYSDSGDTPYTILDTVMQKSWMADAHVRAVVYADAYGVRVPLDTLYAPLDVHDLRMYVETDMQEKYYDPEIDEGPTPDHVTGGENTADFAVKFAVGKSEVTEASLSEGMKKLMAGFALSREMPDYNIAIVVSDSPEGSLERNEALAQERVDAVQNVLKEASVDVSRCAVTVIAENWDGVSEALDAAIAGSEGALEGLTAESAAGMKEVIDTVADLDAREKALAREYSREWRALSKGLFPQLRYAYLDVTYSWKGAPGQARAYQDETVGGVKAVSFSPVKETGPSVSELNDRLLEFVRAGDIDGAEAVADQIVVGGTEPMIICNKAMVYMHKERNDEAKVLFSLCDEFPEAGYNLGVLHLLDAEYDEAEPLLEPYVCLNKAINKIALGKTKEAERVLLMLTPSQARQELLDIVRNSK